MGETRQALYTIRWTIVAGVCIAGVAPPSSADPIDSASFFKFIPHTRIDFETRGNGTPLTSPPGDIRAYATGEYSQQGLLVGLDTDAFWIHDASPDFQAALAAGGSPQHTTLFVSDNGVTPPSIVFTVPVRAFGFFVVRNHTLERPLPVFEAYNSAGELIESVQFVSSVVDGTIGLADFGFMGIYSPDQTIERVVIPEVGGVEYDDLYFSEIPAPGSAVALGCGAALLLRRRNRD